MIRMSRQRGVAAVVFLAIFVIILIGVLTTAFTGRSVQSDFDAKTLPVLASAKQALIAYAAAHPIAPGRLPCPDTVGNGDENCDGIATDKIGRLPWKTLGIPIPRDGSGECLWYAVSANFLENPVTPGINSDANGRIKIMDDASPTSNVMAGATPETLAVAVVFAPGAPFGTNDRTAAGTTLCRGNNTASAYLDSAPTHPSGSVDNAGLLPNPVYISATPSPTFNDRLVYLTPAELFPSVERRVAAEIRKRLQAYFAINHYYPFAAAISDGTFACDPSKRSGRLPVTIAASCPGLADWPTGLPAWYQSDHWDELTFYAVSQSCASPNVDCAPASTWLTLLNGPLPVGNKQALVIAAGRALPSQLPLPRNFSSLASYLETPENTDGNDTYVTLARSQSFNDVLVVVTP